MSATIDFLLTNHPQARRTGDCWGNHKSTETWFDPNAQKWIVFLNERRGHLLHTFVVVTDFCVKDNIAHAFVAWGELPADAQEMSVSA